MGIKHSAAAGVAREDGIPDVDCGASSGEYCGGVRASLAAVVGEPHIGEIRPGVGTYKNCVLGRIVPDGDVSGVKTDVVCCVPHTDNFAA